MGDAYCSSSRHKGYVTGRGLGGWDWWTEVKDERTIHWIVAELLREVTVGLPRPFVEHLSLSF